MSHTTTHSIVCNAPRARVYELIRRSSDWPRIFEPCLAITALESGPDFERIAVTARVNGVPMTWESRRRFITEVCGIESTLTKPMKLVRTMTTSWRVAQINSEQCLLVLEHAYTLDDEVAGQVDGVQTPAEAARFIEAAIDVNSRTELGNIKAAVESGAAERESVALDQHASCSIVCAAPADSVYAVIRNTANWPRIIDACVSATRIDGDHEHEVVRIEALQEGHRMAWNTRRSYFDAIRRIDYELPVPMPFLSAMRGQWRVVPLGEQRCLLTVDRSWRMLDDVRGIRPGVETVAQASAIFNAFVNDNAKAEMNAIRLYVEGGGESFASFSTSHHLPYSPDAVYQVLANVATWPDVLPHCESLQIVYDDAQYQEFVMRVQTPRGIESFRSVRRCDADELSISYFQPQPPRVLRSHHGSWLVRSAPGGCQVFAQHSVQIDAGACVAQFGDSDAMLHKQRIKDLLATNSGATVKACAAWLQRRAKTSTAAEVAS